MKAFAYNYIFATYNFLLAARVHGHDILTCNDETQWQEYATLPLFDKYPLRPQHMTDKVNFLVNNAADACSNFGGTDRTMKCKDYSKNADLLLPISASSNNIKTVSLSPFIDKASHSDEDRARALGEIQDAVENVGFFVVENHGIESDVIYNAHRESQKFFDRTADDVKKTLTRRNENGELMFRGYTNNESIEQYYNRDAVKPDPVEKYDIGHVDNVWPSKGGNEDGPVSSFQVTMEEYYKEMNQLSTTVLAIFEEILDVDPGTVNDLLGKGTSNGMLRCLHYQAQERLGQEVLGGHTDQGTMTIVSPGDAGYEIMVNDQWELIPFVSPEYLVVNVGDVFQMLTNDKWISAVHRVRAARKGKDRLSFAYFANQSMEDETEEDKGQRKALQVLKGFREGGKTSSSFGEIFYRDLFIESAKKIRFSEGNE